MSAPIWRPDGSGICPVTTAERFEVNLPMCLTEGHLFRQSWETGEPLGPCSRCGISVEGAEREDEEAVLTDWLGTVAARKAVSA